MEEQELEKVQEDPRVQAALESRSPWPPAARPLIATTSGPILVSKDGMVSKGGSSRRGFSLRHGVRRCGPAHRIKTNQGEGEGGKTSWPK